MHDGITVPVDDIVAVYELLEDLNQLFHQPQHYRDQALVELFAKEHYREIHRLYYDVVWNWLPPGKQRKIEEQ